MKVRVIISNPTEWYKQLGSYLIRRVDGCSGSHVSIELDSYAGNRVYEAVWPRSRKLNYGEWLNHNKIVKVYEFKVKPGTEADVLEYLEAQLNKLYSIPQLALILIDYIDPYDFKPINGNSALICSELVSGYLEKFHGSKFNETSDTVGVLDIELECDRLSRVCLE
jgi:hypothetical protein